MLVNGAFHQLGTVFHDPLPPCGAVLFPWAPLSAVNSGAPDAPRPRLIGRVRERRRRHPPGRARVSPPPPPLRTVLETFASHGSSKSLTARILKIISRGAF